MEKKQSRFISYETKGTFSWGKVSESHRVFTVEKRNQALQKALFLGYPNETDPYTLTADASLFVIGAIIFQGQHWGETIIAYSSKTINKIQ